ncbi:MAG: class I SAM-dependent methyltransferase [Thaumarchaeota archaeon]|nr:class I SAM-dependent methyltransferase [Nitrososphaerota archaeon]
MAVDRAELSANLRAFYDFRGKSAVCVGAGGGLLLDPATGVRSVVAVDRDAEALEKFRAESATKWAGVPIRFVNDMFEDVRASGDVVYLEFCMHQMKDPRWALEHARSLAPDVVVLDHLPRSMWVYYWAGEGDVAKSTETMESFGIRRRSKFTSLQRFKDWKALADRLSGEGEESRRRVLELKDSADVQMAMDYAIYLL